jgi:benzil reductase ((S)-benzoin forming)
MNLYIVTGTTQGLGAALAARIAQDPANELIALARAPDGDIPGGTRFEVDLARSGAIDAVFDRIEARLADRRYDKAVLVNNAGVVSPVGPLDEVDGAALERNLLVNFVAPVLLMRRFLRAAGPVAPLLRIVNISSGAGRKPYFGWGAYCAAKAGLDMATRVVALEAEARRRPVQAVSLAPGVIDTAMQGVLRDTPKEAFVDVERFRALKAEGQLRAAEDVAADILRLETAGTLQGDAVLDLRALG